LFPLSKSAKQFHSAKVKSRIVSSSSKQQQLWVVVPSNLTLRSPTIIKHHQTVQEIRQLRKEAGVSSARYLMVNQQDGARQSMGCYTCTNVLECLLVLFLIGIRIWAFDWFQNRWRCMA